MLSSIEVLVMKRRMGGVRAVSTMALLLSVGMASLFGQAPPPPGPAPATPAQSPATPAVAVPAQAPPSSAAAPSTTPRVSSRRPTGPKTARISVGLRVRFFPAKSLSSMGENSLQTTTTTPLFDWNFHTTPRSPSYGGGAAVDLNMTRNLRLRGEFLFHRLRYDKVADIYWGGDDPTTPNDERNHMARTERTKARLFDVPLMLQYQGFGTEGLRKHLYLAFGGVVRNVSTVKTSLDTVFQNGDKITTTPLIQPSKRNLIGATVGLGFRFIDDFNIKTTPEIRYTRWAGNTFGSDSTQSPRSQLELGIGFTF
jgi:hypothetical protein